MKQNPKSKKQHDFGGFATKYNVKCTDGRTIGSKAFAHNDGTKVPLVWQHNHNTPENVLGYGILKHLDDGMYVYGFFNDTPAGKAAKEVVLHGDIDRLSIYANALVEQAKFVQHGEIREVSLVYAGANPGAHIDYVAITHGDGDDAEIITSEDAAIIYSGDTIDLKHEDQEEGDETKENKEDEAEEVITHASERKIKEIVESMNEEQKTALYAIVAELLEGKEDLTQSDTEGDENIMKQNAFDVQNKDKVISHEDATKLLTMAKEKGVSLKAVVDSYMAEHEDVELTHAGTYGIDNISVLFPDAQNVRKTPDFVDRSQTWVKTFFGRTNHVPFSRIKSAAADITVESARALGYVTGALKKEEVFALTSRVTLPQTIYKKQKLDRDDIVDIVSFDVVAWLKMEMRGKLNEEVARAGLVGDGRDVASEDKILTANVRPIYLDDDFYAHHYQLAETVTNVGDVIDEVVKSRKYYKRSGNPVMFTTTDWVTDMLLLKDTTGRRIYPTMNELMSALRVSDIVEVEVMEGLTRDVALDTFDLIAILVNPADYTYGADRGGEVNLFDDFDIDYNQYKYLMETRVSGCLTFPKSAIVIERKQAAG